MTDADTQYTANAVCPYCGHMNRDSWEIDLGPGIDGDGTTDCGECGREFFVQRHARITYSTRRLQDRDQ